MDKSPNNELKEEKERIRERKDAQLIIFSLNDLLLKR